MKAEHAVIGRIAQGDRDAFRELYDRYYKAVYLYAYRLLGEEAEDVANEVMMEIWKGAKRFKGRSQVSTWIFGIAANKVRKKLKKGFRSVGEEGLEEAVNGGTPPDEVSHRLQLKEKFKEALERLSPEHREVLHLAYYEDLSVKEISEIVGCPLNTVKTRMFYARQRLRAILEQMGVGREAICR
ncbi:MAG: RNA polymerase subunit sigma [Deltaproteobacteria bacterium]|nr:MAG: RNA polymerase subunit sigma [Deltaproteobacteria bacterium]